MCVYTCIHACVHTYIYIYILYIHAFYLLLLLILKYQKCTEIPEMSDSAMGTGGKGNPEYRIVYTTHKFMTWQSLMLLYNALMQCLATQWFVVQVHWEPAGPGKAMIASDACRLSFCFWKIFAVFFFRKKSRLFKVDLFLKLLQWRPTSTWTQEIYEIFLTYVQGVHVGWETVFLLTNTLHWFADACKPFPLDSYAMLNQKLSSRGP